ncbi:MAG: ABC transporter permease [Chloroflexota bacterium]|nr:ABC transporter permease [Chloroflexota bacterium]
MNPRVAAVVENEWAQLVRNKVVIFTTLVPPFLLVGMAIAVLLLTMWIDIGVDNMARSAAPLLGGSSDLSGLTGADTMRAALLSPFLVLFQMIPLVVPITIASYSIIGEKQSKSLEALLSTPIRTWELLLGKALASALPGVLATWYSFIIFAVVAHFTVSEALTSHLILGPTWMLTMLVLTPLFSLLAVGLAIIISSRVKDPQSAQQLGSLLVLPLVGALVAQVTGAVSVNVGFIVGSAMGVALLDAFLLFLGVRLFRRETILTSWK